MGRCQTDEPVENGDRAKDLRGRLDRVTARDAWEEIETDHHRDDEHPVGEGRCDPVQARLAPPEVRVDEQQVEADEQVREDDRHVHAEPVREHPPRKLPVEPSPQQCPVAEQEQVGHRREVATDRDHGQSSRSGRSRRTRSRRRSPPASGRAWQASTPLYATIRPSPSSTLWRRRAASAPGRPARVTRQGNPPEPLERAREDDLDRGAAHGQESSRGRRPATGSSTRSVRSGPALSPRSTGWRWSGRGRRPGSGGASGCTRPRKEPVDGGAELARDDCDRREARVTRTVTFPPSVRKTSVRRRAGGGGT